MDVSTQVDLHGGFGAPAGSISIDWDRRATPLYSREDIKEQYCITSRQLDAVEKSSGGFFGCLSTRGPSPCASARTSILSACVRSVPSDENLCDAPYPRRSLQIMYRQPYPTYSRGLSRYDFEDEADWIESSYFRRRPRSFCTVPDPKRWVSKHLIFADEIFQDAISLARYYDWDTSWYDVVHVTFYTVETMVPNRRKLKIKNRWKMRSREILACFSTLVSTMRVRVWIIATIDLDIPLIR